MNGSAAGTTALGAEHHIETPRPLLPRAVDTILYGGLIAGTLDILDAFIVTILRGGTAPGVLRYIARGVLGDAAVRGGAPAAALGLLLHFVIALGAATVYFLAARRLSILVRRPVLCGLAFGIGVYLIMRFVVVPLSLIPPSGGPPTWPLLINQLAIHAVGVGLPIAYFAARSARRAVLRG